MPAQAILEETKNAPKLKAFIDGALVRLRELKSVEEELDQFKADRAKHLAELKGLRAEADEHRKAKDAHQFAIDDLLRQKARAQDELDLTLRDLARVRADFERIAQQVKRLNK